MKVPIGGRAVPGFRRPLAPDASGEGTFMKRITPCLQRGIGRKAGSGANFKAVCASKAALFQRLPASLPLPILMS
jgi:hypothetical protein